MKWWDCHFIASLSYASPFTMTRLRPMKGTRRMRFHEPSFQTHLGHFCTMKTLHSEALSMSNFCRKEAVLTSIQRSGWSMSIEPPKLVQCTPSVTVLGSHATASHPWLHKLFLAVPSFPLFSTSCPFLVLCYVKADFPSKSMSQGTTL